MSDCDSTDRGSTPDERQSSVTYNYASNVNNTDHTIFFLAYASGFPLGEQPGFATSFADKKNSAKLEKSFFKSTSCYLNVDFVLLAMRSKVA